MCCLTYADALPFLSLTSLPKARLPTALHLRRSAAVSLSLHSRERPVPHSSTPAPSSNGCAGKQRRHSLLAASGLGDFARFPPRAIVSRAACEGSTATTTTASTAIITTARRTADSPLRAACRLDRVQCNCSVTCEPRRTLFGCSRSVILRSVCALRCRPAQLPA